MTASCATCHHSHRYLYTDSSKPFVNTRTQLNKLLQALSSYLIFFYQMNFQTGRHNKIDNTDVLERSIIYFGTSSLTKIDFEANLKKKNIKQTKYLWLSFVHFFSMNISLHSKDQCKRNKLYMYNLYTFVDRVLYMN